MVKDINPGGLSSGIGPRLAVNRTLYFFAKDGTTTGLWRSDGTDAGTTLVKGGLPDADSTSNFSPIVDVNGTLFFGAFDGTHSTLWRSDGTEAGTTLVKSGFRITLELTGFRGTLYFRGDDGVNGRRCGEATAPRPARRWSSRSTPAATPTNPAASSKPAAPSILVVLRAVAQ